MANLFGNAANTVDTLGGLEFHDFGDDGLMVFQDDENGETHSVYMSDETFENMVQWRKYLEAVETELHSFGDDLEAQDLGDDGCILYQADDEGEVHTIHMTESAFEHLARWRRSFERKVAA